MYPWGIAKVFPPRPWFFPAVQPIHRHTGSEAVTQRRQPRPEADYPLTPIPFDYLRRYDRRKEAPVVTEARKVVGGGATFPLPPVAFQSPYSRRREAQAVTEARRRLAGGSPLLEAPRAVIRPAVIRPRVTGSEAVTQRRTPRGGAGLWVPLPYNTAIPAFRIRDYERQIVRKIQGFSPRVETPLPWNCRI